MNEFLRCLLYLDVAAVRKIWAAVSPGQHQPKDNNEALILLHYARTQTQSVPGNMRTYSHRWLVERGLPSGLPDEMKPNSDRAEIVEAVGVSVKSLSVAGAQLAMAIERAMSDAVAEAYADGNRNTEFVKARMNEARERVMRG